MNEPAKQPETGPAPANASEAQGGAARLLLPPPPRVFLQKEEIGPWLKVSDSTIEEWMRRRVIPVVKIGKVRLYNVIAVERALEKFTVKAVGDFPKA